MGWKAPSARTKTQLALTFAAVLAAVDLFYDADTTLTFLRSKQWHLLGTHITILLVSGGVEACVLVSYRTRTFRFALSFLRLNLIPDFYQIFARPSYSTLHPQFAQPVALGIQAMLKAIPTLMLQSHVAVIRAGGSPSSERVLSALLTPQLALGCASVAFGLAACEAEDFKHRNIIQPLSYASPRFLLLLGYRVVELSSRTLALTYTAVMAPVAVAVAFVAHCGFVNLVGASPQSRHAVVPGAMYSDTAFTRSWQAVILFLIYWDFRISRTVTLMPVKPSSGFRLLETLLTVGYLHTRGLLPSFDSVTLIWLILSVATHALTPFVYGIHWSGHAKVLDTNESPLQVQPRRSLVKGSPRSAWPTSPMQTAAETRKSTSTPTRRPNRTVPYVAELRQRLAETSKVTLGSPDSIRTSQRPAVLPKSWIHRKATVPPKTPRAVTAGVFFRRSELTDAGAQALNTTCHTSEFTATRLQLALARVQRKAGDIGPLVRTEGTSVVWYHADVLDEAVTAWSKRRCSSVSWQVVDRRELPSILKYTPSVLGAVLSTRSVVHGGADDGADEATRHCTLLSIRFDAGINDSRDRFWLHSGKGGAPEPHSKPEFNALLTGCDWVAVLIDSVTTP